MKRPEISVVTGLSYAQLDVVLDALCRQATVTLPSFRFRPFLHDPKDDLVVECALSAGAATIVTDDRHFRHPSLPAFGLRVVSASEFVADLWSERR